MGIVSGIGFEVGVMVGMGVGVGIVEGGTGTGVAVTGGVRAIWVRLTLLASVAVQRLTSLTLFHEGNEGRNKFLIILRKRVSRRRFVRGENGGGERGSG